MPDVIAVIGSGSSQIFWREVIRMSAYGLGIALLIYVLIASYRRRRQLARQQRENDSRDVR